MDKRIIEQMFLEAYGYRGDIDELSIFALDRGIRLEEPYLDYEKFRYHAQSEGKCGFAESDASDVSEISDEFFNLLRETFKIVFKKAVNRKEAENNEIATEFAYMISIFMLKSALYFLYRKSSAKGFCCNL